MPAIAGWLASRGIVALPGYFIADTPWAGTKTNTNFNTQTQVSTLLSGGRLDSSGAQNDLLTEDHYLAAGTFKFAMLSTLESNRGIYNITGISGTQTIDAYAAAQALNTYSEVTGITVTAGLKTVQVQMATKNASAVAYLGSPYTFAIVRTGA